MRKLFLYIFLMNCILFINAKNLKPRILIIPVENNASNSDIYNTVCSRINDTLVNSLKFLGKYEINSKRPDKLINLTTEQLQTYTKEHYIDNVIYTTLESDENNKIIIKTSLYESKSNKILLSKEYIAENLLDIFSASDILIYDMLGNFSTEHIGFGGVSLINSGEKGTYSVYINTAYAGDNINKIPALLNGQYSIEIVQKRFNKDKVIFRRTILIQENEEISVNFSIPLLMKDEKIRLEKNKEDIRQALFHNYNLYTITDKTKVLLNDLNDISYCPAIESKRSIVEENLYKLEIENSVRQTLSQYNNYVDIELRKFRNISKYIGSTNNMLLKKQYENALQKILVIYKLQNIRNINNKNYETYLSNVDSLSELTKWMGEEYKSIYIKDQIYLKNLINTYILNKNKNTFKFNRYFKKHYGDLLKFVKYKEFCRYDDTTKLESLYLKLQTDINFIEDKAKVDKKLSWNIELGGGSLISTKIKIMTSRRTAFQLGIAGGYNFNDKYMMTIPLDFNFYLKPEEFNIYTGLTCDLLSYQNFDRYYLAFGPDTDVFKIQTIYDEWGFFPSIGAKVGVGLPIKDFLLFINCYMHQEIALIFDSHPVSTISIGINI